MNLLEQIMEAAPILAPCPVCHARRGEHCAGGEGLFHTARELLRITELEAAVIAHTTKD